MTGSVRLVTDQHGRIVEASPGAGQLFGLEQRWLVGKPLAALVAREQVRDFRSLVLSLAREQGPVGAEFRLRRRDGTFLGVELEAIVSTAPNRLEWLLAADSELPSDLPPAAGALGSIPLQRLLARLPVGVVSIDRDLIVDYANPAGRFYAQAFAGRLLPEPFPEFSLRKFASRLFDIPTPSLQLVASSDGRVFELDGIQGGNRDSALLLIHDVTTRERQRFSQEEFAANAAHELRTPISAIASAMEVLQGGAKEVPADLELFLGHIETETARLAKLVDSLLLLSRVQAGQATPSLQLVDVAPLIADIAAALEPSDGVAVRVRCPEDLRTFADPDLLRQAVWNLAANAVTHTPRGEVVLTGRDLGRMVEIEVRDTGPGIDEVHRQHVFDRFYRVTRFERGFGLGLPISREIARALGGTLTLDSDPGEGTRVRLRAPSARLVA